MVSLLLRHARLQAEKVVGEDKGGWNGENGDAPRSAEAKITRHNNLLGGVLLEDPPESRTKWG